MEDDQQRRINEAAEQFADAVKCPIRRWPSVAERLRSITPS